MNKKFGFTLAEVLITLAIIGVVAVLTIPTLITNYKEKVEITHLKKGYVTMSQAYKLAIAEHDTPNNWGYSVEDKVAGKNRIIDILSKYVTGEVKYSDDGSKYIELKDGNNIVVWPQSQCNYFINNNCFNTYVYTKGGHGYSFMSTPKGLYPYGTGKFRPYWDSLNAYKAGRCGSCYTAWVLKYENLDIFKCPEQLSWEGQTKCK